MSNTAQRLLACSLIACASCMGLRPADVARPAPRCRDRGINHVIAASLVFGGAGAAVGTVAAVAIKLHDPGTNRHTGRPVLIGFGVGAALGAWVGERGRRPCADSSGVGQK
jgi:hypothetical protein